MTWRELLTEAGDKLKKSGIAEYEIDAWYLFSEAFGISRAEYFLCRDRECGFSLSDDLPDSDDFEKTVEVKFQRMIELRSRRIPLQQITGHQEFMGLDFLVNEHVLCPRQDTEALVETVLNELPDVRAVSFGERFMTGREHGGAREQLRILDMCAGSGCIGISLEKLSTIPVNVLAADISDEAIKVAESNAQRLGCERYEIVKSDLFEQISGSFDVIVSNPPYIPSAVIETLEDEVRLHEPRIALDGEADGLTFYRKISVAAVSRLTPGGRIYYEIGHDQGQSVSEILRENGFTRIRVVKDLAGLDRVVTAQILR